MRITNIKEYPMWARVADKAMWLPMALLQMSLSETPQRTHFWNNRKLSKEVVQPINERLAYYHHGFRAENERWFGILPRFHMPIFGGWKKYIVLRPRELSPCIMTDVWYVGWVTKETAGISLIPLTGSVRMLIGPEPVAWFGVNKIGDQIEILCDGFGSIGKNPEFAKVPLL